MLPARASLGLVRQFCHTASSAVTNSVSVKAGCADKPVDSSTYASRNSSATGLGPDQLKLIQAALRGEVIPKDSPQAFQTLNSKEYGASYPLLQLAEGSFHGATKGHPTHFGQ